MPEIKQFCFNALGANCFIIWNDSREAAVIDPGFSNPAEKDKLYSFIAERGLKLQAVLLTHGHFDHVFGAHRLAEDFGIPVYMHPDDHLVMHETLEFAEKLGFEGTAHEPETTDIADGDTLMAAGMKWTVIGTPGHTPGCVCYHIPEQNLLFSGDTLFHDTIGRTDLAYGDYDKIIVSIMDKIMGLDGCTDVLPGHGGPTTISRERTHNPFLVPFNEKEELEPDWDIEGVTLKGQD